MTGGEAAGLVVVVGCISSGLQNQVLVHLKYKKMYYRTNLRFPVPAIADPTCKALLSW
jgi:hypothetical protein